MEAMDYPPTLNCYDGHHATNKKTTKNKFKVSLLAAPSQMNESLNQVSCLTLHASIGILTEVEQDKLDIGNTSVPLSAGNDVVRNETVPADAQIVHKRKRSCRVS